MSTHRSIEQEQKAFDSQLEALIPQHRGEYVLFKDGTAIGFFGRHDDAYRTGITRFGPDAVFLVSRVERSQPRSVSLAWDAGVMFGG